uniref:Bet v I/Major latex protein domain-containing protein n=1 Tax=Glycine max TaxID=3847 RepID=C6SX54_SOYBN|nr:unknown [Glycine max]
MAYSQLQKVGTSLQIKASAEQFYDVFCNKPHTIANISPENIQSVEVHKGEWGKEGSIVSWNYLHEGTVCVAKQVLEGIDKENNKMTMKVIEGDVLGLYKSFKSNLQVTPKGKGSVVLWAMEYEKQEDHIPDAHTLLQLAVVVSKKIDAYLTQGHN